MGGSPISGMRVAVAENASASSEALNETTISPSAFFISNALNLAVPLLAANVTVRGPLMESFSCSTKPVIEETFRAPPALVKMSKFLARTVSPEVTSNNLSPGPPASVSTSPMTTVYLPAGKCAILTVKFFPLISSRKAAALLATPSTVSDASSLRCANSPLMLTCCPQEAQISSAANTAGARSHKLMSATAASERMDLFINYFSLLLFTGAGSPLGDERRRGYLSTLSFRERNSSISRWLSALRNCGSS